MRKPLIHTILFVSGIFLFVGIGFFGVVELREKSNLGGYWQVFELQNAYAEDDEGEDEDDGKWMKKREHREEEDEDDDRERSAPDPIIEPTPEPVMTPAVTKKVSPITVRQIPETQEMTILSSLIEPYKPMNGLTYVIYHLPDENYIVQDPDGRFIDYKYSDIAKARKAIDEEGIYDPLFAYSAPNGETFILLWNMSNATFAYREDDGKIVATAYTSKSDLIKNLVSENPYNPLAPYDTTMENTVSSSDIEYALAIAKAEGEVQELILREPHYAVSLERPIVPADHQVSTKTLTEKKVVIVNTPSKSVATTPTKTTPSNQKVTPQAPKTPTPVAVAKPVTPAPAPAPAPVAQKKKVNTTTRAS